MEYRWMIEESTKASTREIRFLLDGLEVSTEAFAQWILESKVERDTLKLQLSELCEALRVKTATAENLEKGIEDAGFKLEQSNRLVDSLKNVVRELIEEAKWCGSSDYADGQDLDRNEEIIKRANGLLGNDLRRKYEGFQQCQKCGAWKEYCRC